MTHILQISLKIYLNKKKYTNMALCLYILACNTHNKIEVEHSNKELFKCFDITQDPSEQLGLPPGLSGCSISFL